MPRVLTGDKRWILEKRIAILCELFDDGYTDADIARMFFYVDRSTITRIRAAHWKAHLIKKL